MGKIRVLIADDHAVLRSGLRMLIQAQTDMEVVGEASTGAETLERARTLQPEVVSLDLNMPGQGSLKIIQQLLESVPKTRVLILTMHDDPAYFRAALAAGATGYVVKTAVDAELLTAIRALAAGRMFIDPSLAGELVQSVVGRSGPEKANPANLLSGREREVLELLAQGHTHQEIADRLFLSVKTVETYRSRLANKLGLRTRADLIRYALDIGLLTPSGGNPENPTRS